MHLAFVPQGEGLQGSILCVLVLGGGTKIHSFNSRAIHFNHKSNLTRELSKSSKFVQVPLKACISCTRSRHAMIGSPK